MKYRGTKSEGHLSMLCDAGEVFALLAGSSDIEAFLHRTVTMVSEYLDANVSSVYLFEEELGELVLRATVGLNPMSIGEVRMSTDEGLVGLAMREMRPVSESDASLSPYYKYFPEADEEPYGSFAAVPIQRGLEKIGVLTVQRPTGVGFEDHEMQLLMVLTSQLAVAIENARVMLNIKSEESNVSLREARSGSFIISGRSASSGWACGDAVVEGRSLAWEDDGQRSDNELEALDGAVKATVSQLEYLHGKLEERLPEVASLIFSAHLMMLKDSSFTGKMRSLVESGKSAHASVVSVAEQFMSLFEGSAHDYMREKSDDVKDLAERIIMNLNGEATAERTAYAGMVVVTDELLPSEILKLSVEKVAGVVLSAGGVASHVAILARSLALPMVIVDQDNIKDIGDRSRLLVDANVGNVYVEPTEQTLSQFHVQHDAEKASTETAHRMRKRTTTLDGSSVSLLANINLLSELDLAIKLKAEGVGLYRTEFPFLVRQSFPTEEEQLNVYKTLFAKMKGMSVTVRTLDVGGDKALAYFDRAGEPNPELGMRSLRFSLRYPDIFREQIRAIIRASAGAPLRIMFPMVSSLEEFKRARDIVHECCVSLGVSSRIGTSGLQIGMMIEVPSVAEIITELAAEADFFSIGTNDYVQYMLAADRVNERVADYYFPGHPAVLRSLARIVKAINENGKDVTVCGEMAHDCRYVPFFLGIGVRNLSLDPIFLYKVQSLIRGITITDADDYSRKLIACSSCDEVTAIINSSTNM